MEESHDFVKFGTETSLWPFGVPHAADSTGGEGVTLLTRMTDAITNGELVAAT